MHEKLVPLEYTLLLLRREAEARVRVQRVVRLAERVFLAQHLALVNENEVLKLVPQLRDDGLALCLLVRVDEAAQLLLSLDEAQRAVQGVIAAVELLDLRVGQVEGLWHLLLLEAALIDVLVFDEQDWPGLQHLRDG